jgi:hypothetical protein
MKECIVCAHLHSWLNELIGLSQSIGGTWSYIVKNSANLQYIRDWSKAPVALPYIETIPL